MPDTFGPARGLPLPNALRAAVFSMAACITLAIPGSEAHAQFDRPPSVPRVEARGWPPASAGFRAGYDHNSNAALLGLHLRLPVLPSGRLEVVPNGEVAFPTGLREYQGGVDAVLVWGGRRGGLYGGGGVAWRNTVWSGGGSARETRRAPTAVVGLTSGSPPGAAFGIQLEMRWTFPEGPLKPRVLTLGLNVPLWGRRS